MDEVEAYNLGRKARMDGLPSIAFYNKAFWEDNMKHEHFKWRKNINAYAKGWHDGGNSQNVGKKVLDR